MAFPQPRSKDAKDDHESQEKDELDPETASDDLIVSGVGTGQGMTHPFPYLYEIAERDRERRSCELREYRNDVRGDEDPLERATADGKAVFRFECLGQMGE